MAASSISSRLRRVSSAGGPSLAVVAAGVSVAGNVLVSILPLLAEGARFSSSVPGGWTGSY